MQKWLVKRLKNCRVHRINVDFPISEETIDTYIGRKAHIEFLDNSEFIKMLIYKFKADFW